MVFSPEIPLVRCVVHKDQLFVVVGEVMSQTVMLHLTEFGRQRQVHTVYAFIKRSCAKFPQCVKTLLFIGFKQVLPPDQVLVTSARGVLLSLVL
jgi:hypothetical protein